MLITTELAGISSMQRCLSGYSNIQYPANPRAKNKYIYIYVYTRLPALDYTAQHKALLGVPRRKYIRVLFEGIDTQAAYGTQVVDGCTGFPVSRSAC